MSGMAIILVKNGAKLAIKFYLQRDDLPKN